MNWLLEPEVFKEDEQSFINALKDLGIKYTTVELGVPYESYIEQCKEPTLFHGSMQFASIIKQKQTNIKVYCNYPKFECLFYYPRFGSYLFNSEYIMLPFGEVLNREVWIKEHICEVVFIRPSNGYKTFTGVTVSCWDELKFLKRFVELHELILIAPAKDILKEWRCVVHNNKIITACQYKNSGKIVRIKEVPEKVIEYGQKVLDSVKYNPDPVWTLDICEGWYGLNVLEVGSFSCAGLYACDPYVILKEIV